MDVVADASGLSKAVFGSEHMLAIMTAIAATPDAAFTAPAVESATALAGSVVHGMLGRLQRAGLVRVIGRVPGERTLAYERRAHLMWDAAAQLRSEAHDSLREGDPRDR